MTAEPPRSERPPVGTGYAVIGCLAVGIQVLLAILVLLVLASEPVEPQDADVLGLYKAVLVGVWVGSAPLLIPGWVRRSRWIIVVAVVTFAVVWAAGTAFANAHPYSVTVPYGP